MVLDLFEHFNAHIITCETYKEKLGVSGKRSTFYTSYGSDWIKDAKDVIHNIQYKL